MKRVAAYKKSNAFTLIEVLIVISIIGILAVVIISIIPSQQEKVYLATATSNLSSLDRALKIYVLDHGDYPPDVNRDIPPGLEYILRNEDWPGSTWPSSVYDWDNWDIGGERVLQISIRFCDHANTNCNFPKTTWAENFDYHSSVYWCVEGPCRAHGSQPADHPGYCVNCN